MRLNTMRASVLVFATMGGFALAQYVPLRYSILRVDLDSLPNLAASEVDIYQSSAAIYLKGEALNQKAIELDQTLQLIQIRQNAELIKQNAAILDELKKLPHQ